MLFFDDEAYFFFQLSLEKKKLDLKGIFYFKYLSDRQEVHAEEAPVIIH